MNVHILDTHFQGMAQVTAVYLVIGPEGPVLVETGPGSTLTAIRDGLAAHGLRPGDVGHVLLTHIHLDHAGAAGWWARQGALVHVHHVGAPHLVDPSKLLASATRIYGDRMEQLWGEMLPVPEAQIRPLHDGDIVEAGGLSFTALDTPGHAWHHHAYLLDDGAGDRIAFTGDAAGVRLPHVGVVNLPAPPPEFHLETWLATLDKLTAAELSAIYPTHFGPVQDVAGHLAQLRGLMTDSVEFVAARVQELTGGPAEALPGREPLAPDVRSQLLDEYVAWTRARAAAQSLSPSAVQSYELANPLFMSVDGILLYLRKRGG